MRYRDLSLDPFQQKAIEHLRAGHCVIVSAPTGTGKTIIADWIVEEALKTGKRVIYTAPVKALSNQKFRDYCKLHGEENVGLVTGDLVIRREAPCRVMTTEILRNMLLSGEDVSDLLAVILDEIHFLDDKERGTVWEEVLIYLPPEVVVVGLSATLANLESFASWLEHVRERTVAIIEEHERAVPLTFQCANAKTGLITPDKMAAEVKKRKHHNTGPARHQKMRKHRPFKRGRPGRHSRNTGHLDVFAMLYEQELVPYLYFVFSRADTERCAFQLGERDGSSLLNDEEQKKASAYLKQAKKEIGPALDPELESMYQRGIAFHHAGLHVQLKALVEQLYERRLIKVLYCTSTFALGINMPARAVVFDGLKKYNGQRMAPLTTRQFMQKAGRAGRRGLDEAGTVVLRMDFEDYGEAKPLLNQYFNGTVEPIRSSFNLSWNSIVNLIGQYDADTIRKLVNKSFLNWNLSKAAERQRARAETLVESRGANREVRRLRKRADRAVGRCWDEFQAKVGFLQAIGYLDKNNGFCAGAQILQHLQIAEVLMTELVLSGLLEDLDPPTLFGILCALSGDLPRHTQCRLPLSKDDRRRARSIGNLHESKIVMQAEEISAIAVVWTPAFIPIGRAWIHGTPLHELMEDISSRTDISGDLISCFRRAKDLAGQLRVVYRDFPAQQQTLTSLIRKAARDEVEAVG